MIKHVTYVCDICGEDITNKDKNICQVCGRDHCKVCHKTVKGSKDMLTGICLICSEVYEKFKKQMDERYYEHDELYKYDVLEINNRWKEESLLIDNKGETK